MAESARFPHPRSGNGAQSLLAMGAVFLTGASGFLGRALGQALVARGTPVRGLVRRGSEHRLPAGVEAVLGDALDAASFRAAVAPGATFVHLVGTAAPAPWKARAFERIDGGSLTAALEVARAAPVAHFVYLSVAQPAPILRAYVAVRAAGEARLAASGLPCTFVRPWYVLGPGRRWPLALLPLYALAARLPATAEGARRLGLVSLAETVVALLTAIDHPGPGVRVLDVPEIKRLGRVAAPGGAR